jgi:hypothetical protein
MKTSMKTMMLTAAVSGLLGGTATRLQAAQTTPTPEGTAVVSARNANTGKVSINRVSLEDKGKHSCKGKNDCKGRGGCATDGSKPPQVA